MPDKWRIVPVCIISRGSYRFDRIVPMSPESKYLACWSQGLENVVEVDSGGFRADHKFYSLLLASCDFFSFSKDPFRSFELLSNCYIFFNIYNIV